MRRLDHTEIICVIDRSGSMSAIKDDAIGGFNAFVESQKQVAGTASLTLILFDHEYKLLFQNRDLHAVEPLTKKTFVPRGQTALFDAVGRAIEEVGGRLSAMPEEERPEKVLVCILTDGAENDSRRYSREMIRQMIDHQRSRYSWEFAFLAANQDAFAEAESVGIGRSMTASFDGSPLGARNVLVTMSRMASTFRKGETMPPGEDDEGPEA